MQGSPLRALGGDAARLTLLARWAAAPLVAAVRRLRGLRGARHPDRVEVALADWQAWSTPVGRRGVTIRCTEGQLWITHEGDREDHLLQAGEELRLARAGLLVLVALSPARGVIVVPP